MPAYTGDSLREVLLLGQDMGHPSRIDTVWGAGVLSSQTAELMKPHVPQRELTCRFLQVGLVGELEALHSI